jgi:N-acyl-D-amino-acid deacylase
MIDAIIAGARIYDGVDTAPFVTDLAIVGERIALLGDLAGRDAYARVDGRALTLAPGFIDVHSHSDELWLADGRCESKIMQGVTTEIAGNCGTSVAPLRGEAEVRKAHEARAVGVEIAWREFDEFFDIVERSGVALNVASLVGLGTTRRCVRGDREGRLDDDELPPSATSCARASNAARSASRAASSTFRRVTPTSRARRVCAVAARCRRRATRAHLRSEGDDLARGRR